MEPSYQAPSVLLALITIHTLVPHVVPYSALEPMHNLEIDPLYAGASSAPQTGGSLHHYIICLAMDPLWLTRTHNATWECDQAMLSPTGSQPATWRDTGRERNLEATFNNSTQHPLHDVPRRRRSSCPQHGGICWRDSDLHSRHRLSGCEDLLPASMF